MFLNSDENELELARKGNNDKTVDFLYTDGDVLKIKEYGAIIKLNSMEIKCPDKDYGIMI